MKGVGRGEGGIGVGLAGGERRRSLSKRMGRCFGSGSCKTGEGGVLRRSPRGRRRRRRRAMVEENILADGGNEDKSGARRKNWGRGEAKVVGARCRWVVGGRDASGRELAGMGESGGQRQDFGGVRTTARKRHRRARPRRWRIIKL